MREVAVALDFRRAGMVKAKAPVRDVAVVPDPVEKLAAAGVVVPAPVLVDTHINVGLHARRADPRVVVEVLRGLPDSDVPRGGAGNDLRRALNLFRKGGQLLHQRRRGVWEIMVAAGEADFDADYIADKAVAHDLRSLVEWRL